MKKIKQASKKILVNPFSFPSGRILRDALQEITGDKIFLVTSAKDNIIFRYGCSKEVAGCTAMNTPEFVRMLSNKKLLADKLISENIHAPKFTRELPENYTFPLVHRSTLTSYGGRGITVVTSEEDLQKVSSSGWYTPFVKMSKEFRVHVFKGKILRLFEKIPNNPDDVIKNNASCHFSLREFPEGKYTKVKELIENLNRILGTDNYYALDIGWCPDTKSYFVIEGNSAPGLNENTAKAYAEAIKEILWP